jgi:HdeA/HdeB family
MGSNGPVKEERGFKMETTMKPWLVMLGLGSTLLALPAVRAQETIDINKIMCSEFVAGQVTDSRSLAIWLNGYLNGEHSKTLIDRFSVGENNLIDYCLSHANMPVLEAAETWLAPTNSYPAVIQSTA